MKLRNFWLVLSLMLGTALSSVAQDYYDDDIYFNADKAKKEQAEKARKAAEAKRKASQPLPGSDQYVVFTDNNRNVDEYNRRNLTPQAGDTAMIDTGDFTYTRRIERFYNPEIVSGSGNDDLKYNYYESVAESQADPVNVNIYVTDINPWSSWYYTGWRSPWYNSWWDSYYYNYGPGWWGPSYAWGWGPSWSWSWGWGPSWSWGPGWGYPVGGWGPSYPYRPSVGGMITHRPHQGNYNSGYAPTYGGRRPGTANNGNSGSNRYNGNYNTSGSHNNNSNYNGTTGGRRPGANSGTQNNNSNSNHYNSNSNSNRNSGSSFGTSGGRRPGAGSGFSGGSAGGHRGGAGSGGGRRR